MTTVSREQDPLLSHDLSHEDATRLLQEMTAVVRTIFALEATTTTEAPSVPASGGTARVPGGPADARPADPTEGGDTLR